MTFAMAMLLLAAGLSLCPFSMEAQVRREHPESWSWRHPKVIEPGETRQALPAPAESEYLGASHKYEFEVKKGDKVIVELFSTDFQPMTQLVSRDGDGSLVVVGGVDWDFGNAFPSESPDKNTLRVSYTARESGMDRFSLQAHSAYDDGQGHGEYELRLSNHISWTSGHRDGRSVCPAGQCVCGDCYNDSI